MNAGRYIAALLLVQCLRAEAQPLADHHQHLFSSAAVALSGGRVKAVAANDLVDLENPEHVAKLRAVFEAANERGMAILLHIRPSVSQRRPYGASQARIFLDEILPAAPDVVVQIAHLAGAGGYDDPAIDEALGVYADAAAANDPRMANVFFDISGVAGIGEWRGKTDRIALRIRQLGVQRMLFGSDGTPDLLRPMDAWAAVRELPLTEDELGVIVNNVAPYLR